MVAVNFSLKWDKPVDVTWIILVLALLSGSITRLQAATNQLDLEVGAAYFAESNRRLAPAHENAIGGLKQQLKIINNYKKETTSLSIGTELSDEYLSDQDLEENDYKMGFISYDRNQERAQLYANARIVKDNKLADDFISESPLTVNVDRTRWYTTSGFNYDLQRNFSIGLNLYGERVEFNKITNQLQEYDYIAASISPQWRYSENSRLYAMFSSSLLQYDKKSVEMILEVKDFGSTLDQSTTLTSKVGWKHNLSEQSVLDFNVGYRETDYIGRLFRLSFVPSLGGIAITKEETEEKAYGLILDFSWSYKAEDFGTRINISQSAVPNSTGDLINKKNVKINQNYYLTERSSLSWGIDLVHQRSDFEIDVRNDIDSVTLFSKLEWSLSRNWFLYGRYRYLYRELVSRTEQADSQRIEIGFFWRVGSSY